MKRHNFLLAFMCLVLTACTHIPLVDEQLKALTEAKKQLK